jgi:DNA (cytosine-5)-methyltransferase 1
MIEYEIGTGMRYLSVCDGIGVAHLSWQPLGWSCVGVSEIAAFPTAVVRHHYGFRQLGDMTRFRAWSEELLAGTELVAAGTPCPSYSGAGKRRGLADERGALLLEFADLCNHVNMIRRKHGLPPAIVFFENVPGLRTSRDNAFGEFVGRLLGCDEAPRTKIKGGAWPKAGLLGSETARVSWRVFDSLHFGVAQRRKRVFLLGVPTELIERFGDRVCPSRILSLRSSGEVKTLKLKVWGGITLASWVAKPSESVEGSVNLPWLKGVPGVCSLPCRVNLSKVLETGPVDDKYYISAAAKASSMLERAKARGKQLPALYKAVLEKMASGTAGELAVQAATEDGTRVALAIDGFNQSIGQELHHTLRVGRDSGDAVVVLTATSEVAGTLTASRGNGFRSNGVPTHGLAIEGDRLRVLTPLEWEWLMGVPGGFTLIPYRKNTLAADSPRYEALGNAIVAPIQNWIGRRIEQAFAADPLPGLNELSET